MKFAKVLKYSAWFLTFFLAGCAGNRTTENPMGDSGCAECGEQGEIELEIFDEKGFVEINPKLLKMLDSKAILGSFPTQKMVADCPEDEKICHSFSEDAVDFDLAHFEDSLLEKRFPQMVHEQMLEGLRIPESDSAKIKAEMENLLKLSFADGEPLNSLAPWNPARIFDCLFRIRQSRSCKAAKCAFSNRQKIQCPLPVDSCDGTGSDSSGLGTQRRLYMEVLVDALGRSPGKTFDFEL